MALAYPQGECFFKRSALKSSKKDRFDAENPLHFYSCLVVEMIWNREAHHGSNECKESNGGHPHKRADYKMVWGGGGWQTTYGNWSHLPFSYGDYTQPSRRVQHELCTSGSRFKKREQGDAYESWFMFVPLPTRHEEWVFIDRLCCIRAIYIPVAHESSEKSPDLCTYLHVAFNNLKEINLEYHKDKTPDKYATMYDFEEVEKTTTKLSCHATFGLVPDGTTALGLNIAKLVTTLVIPREHRKYDAFSCGGIILVDSSLIPVVAVQQTFTDPCMANWAKVAGANHGLTIEWGKGDYKTPWFLSYLKNALTFAAGFIPFVGFIVAAGTSIAMEAIINPDGVMDELREQIPSVELTEGLIEEFKNVTGIGKDAVKDADKIIPATTSTKKDITIHTAKEDKIDQNPVEESKADSENAKEQSDDKVVDVPAYKALSEAEFNATVKQMAYRVVKQQYGMTVYKAYTSYKPSNITADDLEGFFKLLWKPPAEHRNFNIDDLIELVENENVKDFLQRLRASNSDNRQDSYYQYEQDEEEKGLKIPEQDKKEQARWEPRMKEALMNKAASGAPKLDNDDYDFAKEHSENLKKKYGIS